MILKNGHRHIYILVLIILLNLTHWAFAEVINYGVFFFQFVHSLKKNPSSVKHFVLLFFKVPLKCTYYCYTNLLFYDVSNFNKFVCV